MNPQTAQRRSPPRLSLTPADQGRPLSLDAFLAADYEGGHRYELIHGRLEVSPLPNLPHDDVVEWIVETLRAYARAHPDVINRVKAPARVFGPEGATDPTAPEADAACYHAYPTDRPIAERDWQNVSPVIVVEVVSETTAEKDLERNVELYLHVASIREYWILDPREDPDWPTLTVYRRRGQHWQKPIAVAAQGTYTTRLLPGLTLLVDPHV